MKSSTRKKTSEACFRKSFLSRTCLSIFRGSMGKITYNLDMVTQTLPRNAPARVSMQTIRRMAKQIAERYNPEQIVLFGSYAYGKPTAYSDVDLLVVMDTPNGELETGLEIVRYLHPIPFSVDVVVRSREVLEKRKKLGDWFLIDITAKGKVLYERIDQ